MTTFPLLQLTPQSYREMAEQLDLLASLTSGDAYLCYKTTENIEFLASTNEEKKHTNEEIQEFAQESFDNELFLDADMQVTNITNGNSGEICTVLFLIAEKTEKNTTLFNTFSGYFCNRIRELITELEPLATATLPELLNSFYDHWWIKNTQGEYLYYNDISLDHLKSFSQWHGSTDDYKGKTDHELFDLEVADEFKHSDDKAINADAQIFFEDDKQRMSPHDVDALDIVHPHLIPAINTDTYELIKAPIKNANGERIGLVGYTRDTSMYMPREDRFLHQATSFENAIDLIFVVDQNRTIIDCNTSFLKFTDFNREEVIGVYLDEIAPKEAMRDLAKQIGKIKEKKHHSSQSYIKTKLGELFPVRFNATIVDYKNKDEFVCVVNVQPLSNQANTIISADKKELLDRYYQVLEKFYNQQRHLENIERQKYEYQILFEASNDGLWYLHMPHDGEIDMNTPIYWSHKFREMLGYEDKEEFPDTMDSLLSHVHIEDYEMVMNNFLGILYDNDSVDSELHITFRIQRKAGDYHWFNLSASTEKDVRDNIIMLSGRLVDVDTQMIEHMAMEGMAPITVTNQHSKIIKVNQAFLNEFGYSYEDVLGKDPADLQAPIYSEKFYANIHRDLETDGYWRGEIICTHKLGATIPVLLNIQAVASENGQIFHYIGTYTNISQQKAMEERLKHLSEIDPMTECYNRSVYERELTSETNLVNRYSDYAATLAILDIDFFKRINDTYGHQQGDDIIYALARLLNDEARETDIVARIGGEEFALILPHTALEQGIEFLKRLYNKIGEHQIKIRGTGEEIKMTVSMGITALHKNDSMDDTYKRADHALYLAKEGGRNSIYDSEGNIIISNPL